MSNKYLFSLLSLIIFVLLQGCSHTSIQETVAQEKVIESEPAQNTLASVGVSLELDSDTSINIYDPWESTNRKIYNFNAQLDDYLLIPVVDGYHAYVPRFLRQGINNVYSNFTSVNHTVNAALQLKGKTMVNNGIRFISNTTMGIAGIFDIATGMGFPEIREDFGQVLGHWGVPEGPYVVLPFFGPSNLRDTTGLVADFFIADIYLDGFGMNRGTNSITWGIIYYGLMGVDIRSNISFRYYDSLTPFEYDIISIMYTAQRRVLIGE